MRWQFSLTGAILLAALASGCASTGAWQGGQGPSMEDLGKLTVGVTTAAEVRTLLGPPLSVSQFDRQQREVWAYRRYVDPFDDRHVAVQFSRDGIVREVLVLRDFNREVCGS